MADVNVTDSGTAPTPAATPSTPVAATPATPQMQPATPTPAPTEDRSNWVPSYRVRESREAALREAQQSFSQKEAQYQQRLEQIQSQLHALVGVTPQGNPEVEAVRQQFSQLYPGLSKMEERSNDIMGIIERAGDLESQSQHYWQSYGRQSMDRLFSHASESLGSPLTDEGKRALHSAFTGYVSSSPELTARYANDPTLIDEFWRAFTSSFIDPARRAASATVATRTTAAIPQDTPGGAPRLPVPPKPANLDERMAQGWAQYEQTKKP